MLNILPHVKDASFYVCLVDTWVQDIQHTIFRLSKSRHDLDMQPFGFLKSDMVLKYLVCALQVLESERRQHSL